MFMKVQVSSKKKSSVWRAVGFEPTTQKTQYTTLTTADLLDGEEII